MWAFSAFPCSKARSLVPVSLLMDICSMRLSSVLVSSFLWNPVNTIPLLRYGQCGEYVCDHKSWWMALERNVVSEMPVPNLWGFPKVVCSYNAAWIMFLKALVKGSSRPKKCPRTSLSFLISLVFDIWSSFCWCGWGQLSLNSGEVSISRVFQLSGQPPLPESVN